MSEILLEQRTLLGHTLLVANIMRRVCELVDDVITTNNTFEEMNGEDAAQAAFSALGDLEISLTKLKEDICKGKV